MKDRDGDGLSNRGERKRSHTNPRRADTDRDGLRDRFELRRSHTNPRKADTDGDGLKDRFERRRSKTNPRRKDTDRDGYSDGLEVRRGSNPRDPKSVPRGLASGPAPPTWKCNRSANPSTLAGQVSAAQPGETICLANGDYGTFQGTNKAIAIRAARGAAPTMRYEFGSGDAGFALIGLWGMGGRISSGARNITVANSVFSTYAHFSGLVNSNIVFYGNHHNYINSPSGAPNARISLGGNSSTHSGVTIRNSLLRGGDSDGVFTDVGVNVIGNEFADICENGPNHTDMIQFADPGDPAGGATRAVIRGNYFHSGGCGTQTLASYDSGTRYALIEHNVVDTRRPWGIELYSDEGSIVRHNTVRWYPDSQCIFGGTECGQIDITRKSGDPPGRGTQVYDNVAVVAVRSGSTVTRNDHNVDPQAVRFVGPLIRHPGFRLAAGSPGKRAASDGTDVGIP